MKRAEGEAVKEPERAAAAPAALEQSGEALLERVRGLPGGPQLLDLAAAREDVELIGGATRDLLLDRTPRELDVVVAHGAPLLALELAAALGARAPEPPEEQPSSSFHERFGTAVVSWPQGRIDIATRRAESYAAPGALPQVREGTAEEDLGRRDFTVNAIALGLAGPRRGELRAAPHALEDLAGGRLRVLHERSFIDDPTRLLRLGRYLARLRFEPEARTAHFAAQALQAGALDTVSGARIGAELRLALAEPEAVAALVTLGEIGVLGALEADLAIDRHLAHRALALLPEEGSREALLLACLLVPVGERAVPDPDRVVLGFLTRMEFTAGVRDRVARTVQAAPALATRLAEVRLPSEIRAAVGDAPLEEVALAGSLGEGPARADAEAAARRWLSQLRCVRLRITGDDLVAAGIAPGPEIGRRLAAALGMLLDGRLQDSREAQLRAALEAPA